MDWAIEHLEKEIPVSEVFNPNEIVDAIGVTKGKGFKGKLSLCEISKVFIYLNNSFGAF